MYYVANDTSQLAKKNNNSVVGVPIDNNKIRSFEERLEELRNIQNIREYLNQTYIEEVNTNQDEVKDKSE